MALGLNEHLIHLHSLNVHDYLSKVCGLLLIINEWDDPLQSVLHHYALKYFSFSLRRDDKSRCSIHVPLLVIKNDLVGQSCELVCRN